MGQTAYHVRTEDFILGTVDFGVATGNTAADASTGWLCLGLTKEDASVSGETGQYRLERNTPATLKKKWDINGKLTYSITLQEVNAQALALTWGHETITRTYDATAVSAVVTGSTKTVVKVTATHGAKFDVGDFLEVENGTGGTFSYGYIKSKSTDDLTVSKLDGTPFTGGTVKKVNMEDIPMAFLAHVQKAIRFCFRTANRGVGEPDHAVWSPYSETVTKFAPAFNAEKGVMELTLEWESIAQEETIGSVNTLGFGHIYRDYLGTKFVYDNV